MNKIRGSVTAKLIAWFVCISCAVATVAFGFLTIAGVEEDYFNMTYEQALGEAYKNINALYSRDAYNNMKANKSQKQLTENGFKYGILQTENLADEDFSDEKIYINTNFTKEELKTLDKSKLYLYEIWEYSNDTYEGTSYGLAIDWEELSEIWSTAERLDSQAVWTAQYADAVCYDVTKGIFYYRSEGYYYPVQNVSLFYETDNGEEEYNYIYNFEKQGYMTNYYFSGNYDEEYSAYEEADLHTVIMTTEEDTIRQILQGGSSGYVNFSALNSTNFSYMSWEDILLDNVRYIDGSELTIIDADSIGKQYFISQAGYYLDANYTLYVAGKADIERYWIVSLVPDTATDVSQDSLYKTTAQGIELFYSYGENACIVTGFFVIMTLVSFVFLAYASGWRKNKEGIVLTWFDRMPLEIVSFAVFFAEYVLLAMLVGIVHVSTIRHSAELFLFIAVSGIAVGIIIALWYVLSLCVRKKAGKWWRNTICYRVFNLFRRGGKVLFDNISLLWKLMLIIFVISVLELAVLAAVGDGMLVICWFMEKIIVCAVTFLAALQINELQKAAEKMAEGNLGYKVDTEKMFSGCKRHGENLNKIGEGMSKAVDERMRSERFKTELITNVSHDIKTPLTSIINYVDLLEKEELNNEKAEEYLEVLERQSSKLKKLIEDLVEASKASTGNLAVSSELLEAGVFLTQTVGEFEEKLSLTGIELIVKKPDEPIYILADGRHLWRVTDNLMNNICKYAQPSSRVYVNLEKENDTAVITFRNISRYQLNTDGNELAERFVRGDRSRNTEGHGLGLSIAKSLMDLMGADMNVVVDGDLFKVMLSFKIQSSTD